MSINRRDFLSACGAFAATTALARPIRSELAGLGSSIDDSNGWDDSTAKSYIQDGLMAMWDGIENIGWGQGSVNCGYIADLCGGEPFILEGNGRLTGNSITFNGKSATCNRTITEFGTVECCFRLDSGRVIFYGCTKKDTGDKTPDFMACYRSMAAGVCIEFCIPANSTAIYSPRYAYGDFVTMSRAGKTPYKNGVNEGMYDANNWSNNGGVITIGGVQDRSFDGSGEMFNLRVYEQVLTPAEISYNFSIDQERFGVGL